MQAVNMHAVNMQAVNMKLVQKEIFLGTRRLILDGPVG